jgi:hypothetical protein
VVQDPLKIKRPSIIRRSINLFSPLKLRRRYLGHFDGQWRVHQLGVKPTAPRAGVAKRQAKLIAHEVQRALRRFGRDFEALGNRACVRIAVCAQLMADPKDAPKYVNRLVTGSGSRLVHDEHILSDKHGQPISYRSALENGPSAKIF